MFVQMMSFIYIEGLNVSSLFSRFQMVRNFVDEGHFIVQLVRGEFVAVVVVFLNG